MKILGILQNQWFKDPEKMKRMLATTFKGDRPRFVSTFLFWSCLTGKRLQKAFREDLCDEIIWENASAEIGGKSDANFGFDPKHLADTIIEHNPEVILCFGKVAADGVAAAMSQLDLSYQGKFHIIQCCHPTARHSTAAAELADAAARLNGVLST